MQRRSFLAFVFVSPLVGCQPSDSVNANSIRSPTKQNESSTIQELIANGASPHDVVEEEYGLTRVHLAARNGNGKFLAYLLKQGGDVNVEDNSGKGVANNKTPLHWASTAEVVDILIADGAHLSSPGPTGQPPLATIAFRNQYSALVRLIEHGADVRARDKYGISVLGWACTALATDFPDDPTFSDHELRFRVIKHLLDNGADINTQDNDGGTPLDAAAKFDPRYVRLFLELGANPFVEDKNGKTPLDWAKVNGWHESVELLTKAMN